VAAYARRGGILNNLFTVNLPRNRTVKKLGKSVRIWQNCGCEFVELLFWTTVCSAAAVAMVSDRPTEVKLGVYINSIYSINEQTMVRLDTSEWSKNFYEGPHRRAPHYCLLL